MNGIRDLRESKGLSQRAACTLCDLGFSTFERIENGSPHTTDAEIASVTKILKAAKPTGKKVIGRPFNDPEKQARLDAARAAGESVSAILQGGEPAPAKKAAPKRAPVPTSSETEKALAGEKAAPKKRLRKPRAKKV